VTAREGILNTDRRRSSILVALACYALAALVVMAPDWARPGRELTGGKDAYLFVWFLGWTPHALTHGLNPFTTHALLGGHPANLMWNTAVPLLGLLGWPVTAAFGPAVTLVVLDTAALIANSLAAYLVLRRWADRGPALLAGLLFGFSPFVIGALLGHLHLAFTPLIWVMLALGDDLLIRERPWRRTGVLLGITVAAQALISEEVLLTSALTALIVVSLVAGLRHRQVKARLAAAGRGLAVAVAVAALLLAWPLSQQFFGAAHLTGAFPNIGGLVADGYGTFTPTGLQRLRPYGLGWAARFPASGPESSSYLGIPLLALCAAATWRLRAQLLGQVAALSLLALAVLSLGPHLVLQGVDTHLLLPWRLLVHLPVLENVITVRLSLFVVMFAAILVAVGLSRLDRRRDRYLAAAVGVLALLPLLPLRLPTSRYEVPAFFTRHADRHYLSTARPSLVLPYPSSADPVAMAWQAQAGYRLSLFGGYLAVPNSKGQTRFGESPNPLERALIGIELGARTTWSADDLPRWRTELHSMDPQLIALGPTRNREVLQRLLTQLLGQPGTPTDGVLLWPHTPTPPPTP
jgi:hypothetical protein